MKFTSLTLIHCRRLMSNGYTTFILNCTEKIQLILGTNGCGKSSVIDHLTPLPPDANDFTKEGRKEIRIIQGNDEYVIGSVFSPTTRHSFKKNNKEMNPGGTATVQRELVKQEFDITTDKHDLIVTGSEKFTAMSPARRREWFAKMNANYDYALKVFADLKNKNRDYSGALSLAKKRLVVETAKIISQEEELRLTKEVDILLKELDMLMENRLPSLSLDDNEELKDRYQRGMSELGKISLKLLKIKIIAPYSVNVAKHDVRDEWGELHPAQYGSVEEIEIEINKVKQKIAAKEALLNNAMRVYKELSNTIDLLKKTGTEGIHSVDQQIEELTSQQKLLANKKQLDIRQNNYTAVEVQRNTQAIYHQLNETLAALSANPLIVEEGKEPYRTYGQNAISQYQHQLLHTKNEIAIISNEIEKLRTHKTHYEAHKNVGKTNCPKCHYSWVIGYDETHYQRVCETLEKKETEKKALEKTISYYEQSIRNNEEYIREYKTIYIAFKNNIVLTKIWSYIEDQKWLLDSPKTINATLLKYIEECELDSEIEECEQRIIELNKIKTATQQQEFNNINDLISRANQEELYVTVYSDDIATLQRYLQEHQLYRSQIIEALELGKRIIDTRNNLDKMHDDIIEDLRRTTIAHCIKQIQLSLASKQQVLSSVKMQKALINDIEKNIEILTLQEETSKLLIQELSPTKGMIAEGLLGFIHVFVAKMNLIINDLWSYPLQILDCGIISEEGAVVDYKFRFMDNNQQDNSKNDVSEGSSGMRELFNLVFRLVAMEYLNLAEHPLCLDEFGKTFDAAHRINASTIVKKLIEQKNFSQLFMISHYESMFGSFTNAQMCVICETNIVVPSSFKYNQHVVMH